MKNLNFLSRVYQCWGVPPPFTLSFFFTNFLHRTDQLFICGHKTWQKHTGKKRGGGSIQPYSMESGKIRESHKTIFYYTNPCLAKNCERTGMKRKNQDLFCSADVSVTGLNGSDKVSPNWAEKYLNVPRSSFLVIIFGALILSLTTEGRQEKKG